MSLLNHQIRERLNISHIPNHSYRGKNANLTSLCSWEVKQWMNGVSRIGWPDDTICKSNSFRLSFIHSRLLHLRPEYYFLRPALMNIHPYSCKQVVKQLFTPRVSWLPFPSHLYSWSGASSEISSLGNTSSWNKDHWRWEMCTDPDHCNTFSDPTSKFALFDRIYSNIL